MPNTIRRKCKVKGCTRLQASKGWENGRKIYRTVCWKHHTEKHVNASDLRKPACEICGWDKAICDVHRIIPGSRGGKYEKTNVITLCPNCHRLATNGTLVIPQDLLYSILDI